MEMETSLLVPMTHHLMVVRSFASWRGSVRTCMSVTIPIPTCNVRSTTVWLDNVRLLWREIHS
eukprot:scaffold3282_cov198-Alexandrium_tamarense.AAC.37